MLLCVKIRKGKETFIQHHSSKRFYTFMPNQWFKLIEISHQYHPSDNLSFIQAVIQETTPSLRLFKVFFINFIVIQFEKIQNIEF